MRLDATTEWTEIAAALLGFPLPLLLLDADGATTGVSSELTRRYGDIQATVLGEFAGEGEYVASIAAAAFPAGIERRGLALRVRDHYALLLAEGAGAVPLDAEVERLRSLVSHLQRLAATDHLTGAWNRGQFDRLLAMHSGSESPRSTSLILLDVDHFKRVNDRFGHAVGDRVLQQAVRVIEANTRLSDYLFRWGGEEFALLVSRGGLESARRIAEKIRNAIAAHDFAEVGSITISAGVAERLADETFEAWFERLDRALYDAKRSGRNCVVVDEAHEQGTNDLVLALGLRLQWEEAFECGEPTIDAQHRGLFQQANLLIDAALRGSPDLGAMLDDMIGQIERHFHDEEAILVRADYEDFARHQRAHGALLRHARELQARMPGGTVSLADLIEFLIQDVVAGHFLKTDREFMPLFLQ
ncbi:MAG TPA: diguanylate cyclase [Steroidobacteraceae bacterium]|nr:diguanylate cyclase [Steroidobacteraceae bacterium]